MFFFSDPSIQINTVLQYTEIPLCAWILGSGTAYVIVSTYRKSSNETCGFNVFQQFLQAKKVGFLDFNVIKWLKMRMLLDIRVSLEGMSY